MKAAACLLVWFSVCTALSQTVHSPPQSPAEIANALKLGDKTLAKHQGNYRILANRHVVVRIVGPRADWDAFWLDKTQAAMEHAGFAVECDGKRLTLNAPKVEVSTFKDAFGSGMEERQSSDGEIQIRRTIRIYDGKAIVTLAAAITNTSNHDVSVGTAQLINISRDRDGRWKLGEPSETPAGVYGVSGAHWFCVPWQKGKAEQTYSGSGMLLLHSREPSSAIVIGSLTAREARTDLDALFRTGSGGLRLLAHQPFLGRKLSPGETLRFDPVYVAAEENPFSAVEHYADAAAKFAVGPIRSKATGLWCSWYAHRMDVSEDLVLANAAVAAKHFRPLGLEIMQIDHGWQRGDVTGDWTPNERFPHGLKWLSDELHSRYGLRLGLWIAPTDVAETSETFRQHPDWMLKDGAGKPLVNWRWYWKPNPNCYELDISKPAAKSYIEQTFSRLRKEGASYFKIDFIAASAGEQFVQSNPKVTRGWGVLHEAVNAVRQGAGPEATIRYCQVPSLLAAGVADSCIAGSDTLDAGLNGKIDVLRENASHLAASYWANDRLYQREVCDMSVRMQADDEEAQLRLAMMTLAGCSISFSDELQHLPLSRIRMMQACLPPGNPPMKPLDLFERAIPSIWHVHCHVGASAEPIDDWDVLGLFNFENNPEERMVDFTSLGLSPDENVAIFEFWDSKFLGVHRGSFTMKLPPQSSRILSVRRLTNHPELIGTNMHLLQGFHELKQLTWDDKTNSLSGEFERAPGLMGKAFIYVPSNYTPHFDFPLKDSSAHVTRISSQVWAHEFKFKDSRYKWTLPFDRSSNGH